MLSSKPMDFHVPDKADGERFQVSKGRNLLKSVLLCAALGVSGCATQNAAVSRVSEKVELGADAGNTAEKGGGGSKLNESGEMEERMREKCEEEGYLNPVDCNLDTEPDDADPSKVKFRAVFI